MRPKELLGLVWINLLENKFKVLLTSLGIIVGAATIVLVIAIGQGGKADVADQFKNLNAGAVEVRYSENAQGLEGLMNGMTEGMGTVPGGFSGGGRMSAGGGFSGGMPVGSRTTVQSTLTYEDVEEIALFVPNITAATISASGSYDVVAGDSDESVSHTIVGAYPAYAEITNLSVAIGEFITEESNTMADKVCVLGARVAEDTFGSALAAYNSVVTIDDRDYTVIGVLSSMGSVTSGISPDSAIYLPYSTAEKYLFGKEIAPVITVLAEDVSKVETVMEDVELTLQSTHPGVTYTISDAGSSMEAATQSANTLSMLLIGVASIVFVVGGIGIMNVLFVSVKERTREIGILKALGTSRRDILMGFLLESNFISILGGIIGVAVGLALVPVLEKFDMRLETSPGGALLALAFAVVTGTVFGFYPAAKAAALRPIEALSQE